MKSFPIVILDGDVVIQAQQDAIAALLLLRRELFKAI